jgi:hypothetical protein
VLTRNSTSERRQNATRLVLDIIAATQGNTWMFDWLKIVLTVAAHVLLEAISGHGSWG